MDWGSSGVLRPVGPQTTNRAARAPAALAALRRSLARARRAGKSAPQSRRPPCEAGQDPGAPRAGRLAGFVAAAGAACSGSMFLRLVAAIVLVGSVLPEAIAQSPPRCKSGFVWREAFPGDYVCVTPQTRAQAAEDNRRAAARRQSRGGAFGPNTCIPGYVWREARPGDVVCVTPQTRAQTAADNRAAPSRRM